MAITRVVNLPPEWAELALRAALPRVPHLHLSSWVAADGPSGPCRRLRATLVSQRGWFRLPVDLQLTAWSATATELTLRPGRSGRRPGWAAWYLAAGTALMDQLATGTGDAQPAAGMTPASSRTRAGGRCCSVMRTPRSARASSTALVRAAGEPIIPPSPTPR